MDKPMPAWLQGALIFMAVAAVGNVLSYFMDLSGIILGLLAVILINKGRNYCE